LLYTGEFYDSHSGFYYNRARWYNPSVGRFNRLDPFAGSNRDPQSLHKYLYAHCDPINGMDPSGQFTLVEALKVSLITSSIMAIAAGAETAIRGGSMRQVLDASAKWFLITFATTAALYGGAWAVHSLWTDLVGGGVVTLQQAAAEGCENHRHLVKVWRALGANGEIHHFVQQHAQNIARFGRRAIYSVRNSIPISRYFHTQVTTYTNSSTQTLELVRRYGRYSHLYEYIRGLSWEVQYRWGVAMYDYVVETGTMLGFNPEHYGL